jgi:Regulator of ribonuclease activity B
VLPVVFPSGRSAEEFASHFREEGHKVSVEETNCVPEFPWDVIVVNYMVPTHSAISHFEDTLELWASSLGGRNDGWGCMEQPTSH